MAIKCAVKGRTFPKRTVSISVERCMEEWRFSSNRYLRQKMRYMVSFFCGQIYPREMRLRHLSTMRLGGTHIWCHWREPNTGHRVHSAATTFTGLSGVTTGKSMGKYTKITGKGKKLYRYCKTDRYMITGNRHKCRNIFNVLLTVHLDIWGV
jgi:hypothetical protein